MYIFIRYLTYLDFIYVCLFSFLVPPTIIGPNPETLTVVVNNFVSLSCEATGFPPPTLSWLKERSPIQANTNALVMPGTKRHRCSTCSSAKSTTLLNFYMCCFQAAELFRS